MLFLAGEPEVPPDTLSSQWPDINIGEVRMGGLNQQHNAHVRARDLFNRALFIGQMRKLGAAITRRSRRLLFLGGVENSAHVVNHHQLNRQAVRLELIQGSVARTDEFDIDFYPVVNRVRDRWTSIAAGVLMDVTRFPPLELVQVDNTYYVVDGHHRVSVARALKFCFFDADVTVWEIEDPAIKSAPGSAADTNKAPQ